MIVLNILGTILKIIGILLLGILLFLLIIMFMLLFVPLRYRAQFSREVENVAVHAQVSYLFRLIRLPVDFEDGKLKISLKVFGLTLFSNAESAGGEKKKRKAAKKAKKKQRELSEEEREKGTEEEAKKDLADIPAEHSEQGGKNIEEKTEQERTLETLCSDEAPDGQEQNADGIFIGRAQSPEQNEEDTSRGVFRQIKRICSIPGRIAKKVSAFFEKLAEFYEKIKCLVRDVLGKISTGRVKIADIREKIHLVFTFLRDEENKNGIKYAGKSILRLLKHVFPYKIEGDIVFATGEAYSMGRALSVLGVLYPLYGKRLKLTADFEADTFRLEGRVQFAGRIRFGTMLWIAYKLWRKGKIMRLLSSAKELKHKLTTSAL